ncbi:hypothetical protein GGR52DRAFT_562311 [Hypoxylon sp. FL1284]|nr:hypothetical protein GGR52DRAFT_562311 [Hypoxylon sp. FL1284]
MPPSTSKVACTSRFHRKKVKGRYKSITRNATQYVCRRCRAHWEKRIQNAAKRDELDLICERLEAARILIDMVCDGRFQPEISLSERKLGAAKETPKECAKRKIKDIDQLPLAVLSAVWSRCSDSSPRCALDLLVPDWRVCDRENPLLEKASAVTQVVTYTRCVDGGVGTFSTMFGHGDNDHILLPMKSLQDRLLVVNAWSSNETVRLFFQGGTQVFELAENHLPKDIAGEYLLENWRDMFPMRSKRLRDVLPFDDEQPEEKRKTLDSPPYIFKLLRHLVVNSPLTLIDVDAQNMVGSRTDISEAGLEALNKAIDLDRTSHLWLSWSQMPLLESVLLDLRIYSHDANTDRGCVGKAEIVERAREMGRWLRLKLLVIAGLQSYSLTTRYGSYCAGAGQIEEDDEVDGEPNWVKIFMPAVRPGGKLVLVDRRVDG